MNEILTNIINEILESENRKMIDNISDTMSLRRDLEFDSLDLAIFTVKVEDEFGIDIFENGNIDTLAEVLGCLEDA